MRLVFACGRFGSFSNLLEIRKRDPQSLESRREKKETVDSSRSIHSFGAKAGRLDARISEARKPVAFPL